ncbi:MAG: LytTR family transcriptional regulator DNA-binding domain-containing protein [Chitinophagaceae bacterium]
MNIFTVMSAGVQLFKQKFPYNSSLKNRLLVAAGFGLFVFLFLWGFKPFDMTSLGNERQVLLVSIFYAVSAFACIAITTLVLPLLFPRFFEENKWTTAKQVLYMFFIVLIVGVVNCLLSVFIFNANVSLVNIFWFEGYALATAFLPITIYTLFKQNRLLRHFEQEAKVLEEKLQQKLADEKQVAITEKQTEQKEELILFTGDYQQEKLELHPSQLYYVAAASNYVKIYFEQKGRLQYSIIRITMKKVEESLAGRPAFFRCHRAYIVNLDKVQHVEGNAQGYKLQLPGVEELIPVSRNQNTEFSDRLLAVRGGKV